MVLGEPLTSLSSHTTLAEQLNQIHLAAQSNTCLSPKAHSLATQLTFHCKVSFSGINCIYKIPFQITKRCQYFKKRLFSKVINLSMVILQPIYLPAVAIDKTIFSAQLVGRQIFFF